MSTLVTDGRREDPYIWQRTLNQGFSLLVKMKRKLIVCASLVVALFIFGASSKFASTISYPRKELSYLTAIGIPSLQKIGLDGTGIRIAVIDSGVNMNTTTFEGRKLLGWRDFVNNKTSPYDDLGHGTAVSSVVAGNPTQFSFQNGTHRPVFVGIAYKADLIEAKIINSENKISDCKIAADAIAWVATFHPDLINLSIYCHNTTNGQNIVDQAIASATKQGILTITIAGNFGNKSDSLTAPGDSADAITVGSTTISGTAMQPYSGVGPTQDGRLKPDLVAPSGDEDSTREGILAVNRDGEVRYWWGTSFSAPLVAGIAALLKQWKPSLSPADLKSILEKSATHLDSNQPDNVHGYGLVSAPGAFLTISGETPETIELTQAIQNGSLQGSYGVIAILLGEGIGRLIVFLKHRGEH
jgi:serine protease AprX